MAKTAQKPAPAPAKGSQLTTPKNSPVVVSSEAPAYIRQDTQRGSENVGMQDLVIPRLEIVQGLSPAVKRGDPGFIQGAVAGHIINSVTRQLYGESAMVVPVHFSVQYLVWRKRKYIDPRTNKEVNTEGGFFGAFPDSMAADARMKEAIASEGHDPASIEVIDTPQHLCLLLNPETGSYDEIMVSMPRTKAKVSRQWNSMIKLAGGDRFSRVYKLSADFTKNAKGDFYNFHVDLLGFPAEDLYRKAEELYKVVAAGERKIVMDVSGFESEHGAPDDDAGM